MSKYTGSMSIYFENKHCIFFGQKMAASQHPWIFWLLLLIYPEREGFRGSNCQVYIGIIYVLLLM